MPSECYHGCIDNVTKEKEPVYTHFLGVNYCWNCWLDLNDEHADPEPPEEPEYDHELR